MGRELEPFSDSVDAMFARLGLPNPEVMSVINTEWDELAGNPWAGRSSPMFIKGKKLVIEASSPGMIAFLRYDQSGLLNRLSERFGVGLITEVEITPPSRS